MGRIRGKRNRDSDRYWQAIRKTSCSGLSGAPLACVCFNCGTMTNASSLYNDWCISCVLRWGHPEDANDLLKALPGWDSESALAFVHDHQPIKVAPIILAIQSFGILDLTTEAKFGIGIVNIEQHSQAVASDGFLINDEPAHVGGISREARRIFREAVHKLFRAGFSNRAIGRVTGLSKFTVAGWRGECSEVFRCACGDIATHQGWCSPRFIGSVKRQEMMRRWHPGSEWPLIPVDGFQIAWAGVDQKPQE